MKVRWLHLVADLHRWAWWLAGGLVILLLGTHLTIRYWLLPQVPQQRAQIEAGLSEVIQRPVRLGDVQARWDGWRPRIDIASFSVLDREGRLALTLPAISAEVSWRSLFRGTVILSGLRTSGLELFLRRTPDGTILLADIPLNRGDDNRFADWLQQQRGIDLQHSVVHWDDQMRGAPRLTLREVDISLRNRGERHQLGLRATPDAVLAGPLDVRGEWRGESLVHPEQGHGRLYADVSAVDLPALKPWLDLPAEVESGHGSLRLWVDVDGERLSGITADASLRGLRTRLGPDLRMLDIESLSGRIAVVNRPDRRSVELRRLTLQTSDGLIAPDTSLRWQQEGEGASAKHTVRIDHLVLQPLFATADALPVPDDVRDLIRRAAPRGELRDLSAHWTGDWHAPQAYALRGQFEAVGMAPVDGFPGFDRLSGTVDADVRRGRANLRLGTAPLIWPTQFERPLPVRDAQLAVDWTEDRGVRRFNLGSLMLDTGELRARFKGQFQPSNSQLDLEARLEHLDAAALVHYLPRTVGAGTRDWFTAAFPAGGTATGEAHLQGDPRRFPFVDGKSGRFTAQIDLSAPTLQFGPRWPRLDVVSGRLSFLNARLSADRIKAKAGTTNLENVRLLIPDLESHDPVLDASGQMSSRVPEVLDYVQNSPVRGLIKGATDGMSGQGRVTIKLDLHTPLNHSDQSTVHGDLGFDSIRLDLGAGKPSIAGLTGHLDFTEKGVSSNSLSGNLFGGPARATVSSQAGGVVRIDANGRARVAALAQQYPLRAWSLATGETAWRGDITLGPTGSRLQVTSALEGVTLNLPQPLLKPSAQAMPMRFAWQSGDRGDRYELAIGTQIRARIATRPGASIETGQVALGPVPLPAEGARGVSVSAALPQIFFTQWLPVVERFAGEASAGEVMPVRAALKTPRFEFEGFYFNDVEVAVDRRDPIWNWTVKGRELEGGGQWDAAGKGSVKARFARLALGPAVDSVSSPESATTDYPALDVEVADLERNGRDWGALKLRASQQGRDWKIDQIHLSGAEFQLEASGLWQGWRGKPSTDIHIELTTTDAGKYLERLGYGSVIRAAPGTLKGDLRWRGPPTDIHFPSLSGQFRLEAGKGQFLKADPGVARLLGIVSLQALPRRITLDFRDIFSEGLAFDRIESDLAVNEGVMRTDQLLIDGPAAKVRIKGQADLGRETQDLQVRVSPSMDAATVGALIANPVAGIAVFLLQQILDDPLGKLITFNYTITGSWADPQINKRGSEVSGKDKGVPASPGGKP